MSLDLAPGVVIAKRYRLERALGQGGMGVVWAAVHTLTQKRVALKFLKGPIGLRPEMRRRFLREARAASAVVHPNVLEVHDVFELDDDIPVMLMDLLEGETLGQRIARLDKLTVPETADIMVQVVSAVGTAHAVGVVHRDLKPENVFLVRSATGASSVRVLDFGIAKLVGFEGLAVETGIITGTGSMLGTPCYMSPEQSFGEKDVDYRTDIWSLGCIMYECLTGVRTVDGDSLGQVVKRLINDGIIPITTLEPTLPQELTALVERMLGRDREQRPRDLREVHDILKRFATASAPDFGTPVSEPPTPPVGDSRPAEATRTVDSADVTALSAADTGDATVSDTVKSAEPARARGPETAGAQTVSWGRIVRRPSGISWIVAVALLAVGVPILATRSGSSGSTVPSAAAPRTSTAAPSQPGTAVLDELPRPRAAAMTSSSTTSEKEPMVTPAPSATSPSVVKTKQDVRAAKPAPHSAALPAISAAPPASVAPPVTRPRVGGLAEKPPF